MFNDKLMEIAKTNGYSPMQAEGFYLSMNEEELAIAESGDIRRAIGAMADRTKCVTEDDDD